MRDIFDSGRVHSHDIAVWAGIPPHTLDKRIARAKSKMSYENWAMFGAREEKRMGGKPSAVRAWSFSPQGVRWIVRHLKLKRKESS